MVEMRFLHLVEMQILHHEVQILHFEMRFLHFGAMQNLHHEMQKTHFATPHHYMYYNKINNKACFKKHV